MNETVIVALIGAIATALVSIFSKVSDMPLANAQIDTSASAAWKDYAGQIKADNDELRKRIDDMEAEMERRSKACSDEIAALKAQINGGSRKRHSTRTLE